MVKTKLLSMLTAISLLGISTLSMPLGYADTDANLSTKDGLSVTAQNLR